ncbi:MAG: endonuclease/exonuclease/phosphatase family protein [Kiritimatiellae bacterium]|jgi:endonuclease/exonuclease/phosphatase family metal-dependent hydrolase|nr:endonuclease/exonuclease/phosphatase family protein [Kiritimatiellia bacterium]MDD3583844.1 endonuclease/exonuclease/phosphatase family protein [Kiritimatiellia bacterium]HHU14156.1 hypothetical protein [Lentisphaerota bacterium]HON48691.1 endonuclease/exonuclease/phosphatase family protein [Kiritimatiellia bacterium]
MKRLALCVAVAAMGGCVFAKPITMMSYNIRIGCGFDGPFNLPKGNLGHLPQVAEVIRAADPDWVAIQEIDNKTKRAGFVDQTAELAKLCGMKGTFVRKTLATQRRGFRMLSDATEEEVAEGGEYGLAVLSKEEPIKVSKVLVPGQSHTRCILFVEFADYVVACVHFPLKEEHRVLAAQVALVNAADYRKPVFLVGDFNAEPAAKSIIELKKGMTILNDPSVPTFPSSVPDRCIDYIMVNTPFADRVNVVDRQVLAKPDATDHCAVIVKAILMPSGVAWASCPCFMGGTPICFYRACRAARH